MHDLVHDLALSISQPQKVSDGVKLCHSFFSMSSCFHIATDFKDLRVLNFCDADVSSLSESICMLKHLRYLDISRTRIDRLPKSITKLYHLQTLRLLRCGSLKNLPEGMKNLLSLRHLYIDDGWHVPDEIGCLTNLQTLPIFVVGTKMGSGIGELGCLSVLRGKLMIFNLQNVRNKEEAHRAKIWEKKELHTLRYVWDSVREGYGRNDEEVLEGLEPHSNLKSLTIQCYMGENNPSWLVRECGSPSSSFQPINLVELNLSFCENLKNLPTLGLCTNLRFLSIRGLHHVKCIGKEFYIDNNSGDKNKCMTLFPALEKFTLEYMSEVKEWVDIKPIVPVFPSLKELQIGYCDNLRSVPVMSRFSSLETLTIRVCEELSLVGDGLFPPSLKKLKIEVCRKLRSIPSVEGGISYLQKLHVGECDELSTIEEGLLASTCLRDVNVQDCRNLISISSIDGCSSLLRLRLYACQGLTSLPSGLRTCTSLHSLEISCCNNVSLKSIPGESLGCLIRLKKLKLGPFSEEVEEFPGLSSIHRLHSSLEDLTLIGWEKLSSLPHQLQHLTNLKELRIGKFNGMKALPEWLGSLSSLRSLSIWGCDTLEHLPSKEAMQRLPNLLKLSIENSPRLKENSVEWSKIFHIPEVKIYECGM